MTRVSTKLRAFPKRVMAVAAVAVSAITIPAMLHAWGPERPTYTIETPADHVTFNSITDNPHIGDERNFVGIRENNTNGLWQDSQEVQPGKEYVVRMYVHNNAGANLGLVAENTTAMFNLPTTTGKSIQVDGYLKASNASPQEVYDHATFTSSEDFNLALIPGSIKYHNNANGNGFDIPESLFTSAGATLGYDKMDGKIPGCFEYAGYLSYIVKPQFADKPTDFTIKKEVRKAGEKTWNDTTMQAAAGDKLNYRLTFANTGQTELKNVMLKDALPSGVSLVPGTVRILNAANPQGAYVQDGDKLVSTGVNIGSYTGGGSNAIVIFDATLPAADKLACGVNSFRNVVSATPEGTTPKEDDATTTVPGKECEEPQPKTIEVCRLSDKKYPVTIDENDFDETKHSKNPNDCKGTPKPVEKEIEVCRLSDKKFPVTIKETEFDSAKHSKNPNDCKEAPTPVKKTIEVCRLSDKTYPVTIKETEFNETLYSKNSNDCSVTTPEKPAPTQSVEQLPETGALAPIAPFVGLGSIAAAAGYYIHSRRVMR